jgi:hypothetical protein
MGSEKKEREHPGTDENHTMDPVIRVYSPKEMSATQ